MVNFIQFLLEDAKEDQEKRKTGNLVFDSFLTRLRNPNMKSHLKQELRQIKTDDQGIYFDSSTAGNNYKDLEIVLAPLDPKRYGQIDAKAPSKEQFTHDIYMFVIDLKNKDIEDIIMTLELRRDTFIHEFSHYLDSSRLKGVDKVVKPNLKNDANRKKTKPEGEIKPRKVDSDGYHQQFGNEPERKDFANDIDYTMARNDFLDKYFKDDFETNAFFQQFAHKVDGAVKNMNSGEKKRVLSDFQTFFKTFFKTMNPEQMAVLKNPENESHKKRLLKRFSKYWDFLKSENQI